VGLFTFIFRLIEWNSINFVVTTERCIYRSGVFAKRGIEIPLDRINTVFFNQGVFERLVRAGDLAIESAGENSRQSFSDIYDPLSAKVVAVNGELDGDPELVNSDPYGAGWLVDLSVDSESDLDDALEAMMDAEGYASITTT
jgi:hypothetical protein